MKIYKQICDVLRREKGAALVTIISTSGSTPAPSNSRMLIRTKGDGGAIGTVGGGCLDQNIILSLNDTAQQGGARILTFHLNEDVGDTGLTCGGIVNVLVEPLDDSMTEIYEMICEKQNKGESSVLITAIMGSPQKFLLDVSGNYLCGASNSGKFLNEIQPYLKKFTKDERSRREEINGKEFVMEYLETPPPLIIFGGGHVGKIVSRVGAVAGFRVTIIDDREPYANKERFPEAENILCKEIDEVFQSLRISPADFIVIVTRGHKHDERVLEQVVKYNPRYIGMIGSKRKIRITFDNLISRGVSAEALKRVHAPIGMEIGAENTEEIGISIVAELIAVRRNKIF